MWPFRKKTEAWTETPKTYYGYGIPAGVRHQDRKAAIAKIRQAGYDAAVYFKETYAEASLLAAVVQSRTGVYVEVFTHGVRT